MSVTKDDLLLPVLPGQPREWDAPDDLLEAASETIPQSPLVLSESAFEARQLIAARRWYLVKNEMGEKSRITGRVEVYMTFLGVERPWHGLDDIGGWILREIDPDNTDPSLQEIVDSIVGHWVSTGRIEAISEDYARELSFKIFMKSNGRVDLMRRAERMVSRHAT